MRRQLGDELREARLSAGLSQAFVARRLGCAASSVSRVERGLWPGVSLEFAARLGAVLGRTVRTAVYPTGASLRDAGQLRLLNRLQSHVPSPPWRWTLEMAVAPGEMRAFDAGASGPAGRVAFDAWTRVRDVQAQARRSLLKSADGGVDRLILVLADTSHNRAAVREAGEALLRAFPESGRSTLRALRAGRMPAANGIVFL